MNIYILAPVKLLKDQYLKKYLFVIVIEKLKNDFKHLIEYYILKNYGQ